MPIYVYRCSDEECQADTEENRKYDDRNLPAVCEVCEEPANYIISAPALMQTASPDGVRRKNSDSWQRLKERSKLKLAHASAKTREEKNKLKDEMCRVDKQPVPKKRRRPSEVLDR